MNYGIKTLSELKEEKYKLGFYNKDASGDFYIDYLFAFKSDLEWGYETATINPDLIPQHIKDLHWKDSIMSVSDLIAEIGKPEPQTAWDWLGLKYYAEWVFVTDERIVYYIENYENKCPIQTIERPYNKKYDSLKKYTLLRISEIEVPKSKDEIKDELIEGVGLLLSGNKSDLTLGDLKSIEDRVRSFIYRR